MAGAATWHQWVFDRPNPREKARDPQQAELLRHDDFEPAESLVREAIQNSLDAHRPGAEPVHIRIAVSGTRTALSPVAAARWFEGLQPHVQAAERGGHVAATAFDEQCRYVTIEDFSTTGLTGDVTSHAPERGGNYYGFIWAEGISGKGNRNGGRWGVGKYVFPNASTINTFFALTVRAAEHQPLLIGQSVLQQHTIAGVTYQPDGWWSDEQSPRRGSERGLQVPITDPAIVDSFSSTWSITRTHVTPGLSVVIPYVSTDLDATAFTRAVVRAYYLAILEGRLSVQIVDGETGTSVHLEAGTLRNIMAKVLPRDDVTLSLAQIVATRSRVPTANQLELPALTPAGSVHDLELADEDLIRLRDAIENGEVAHITLHQQVKLQQHKRSSNAIEAGTCHIYLQRDRTGARLRPHFFRSGILVSEATTTNLPGVRALAIVEADALGTMLGDAESPAHTKWTANDRVKSRYVSAEKTINNVRLAPKRLYDLIVNARPSEERIVFSDIFNIPEDTARARGRKFKRGGGHARRSQAPRQRGARGALPLLHVQPAESDGFAITASDAAIDAAGQVQLRAVSIRIAYDSPSTSDSFAKWAPFDFVTSQLDIEIAGGSITAANDNTIDLVVTDPRAFAVEVHGFDGQRDLVVDAHPAQLPGPASSSALSPTARRASHGRRSE